MGYTVNSYTPVLSGCALAQVWGGTDSIAYETP